MHPQAIALSLKWENEQLILLNQTLLPEQVVYEPQQNIEQIWEAIKQLRVRGAPALGVAGAYGLLYAVREHQHEPLDLFIQHLRQGADYLNRARPTAVNLGWALQRMLDHAQKHPATNSQTLYRELVCEAQRIHEEDRALCRGIGQQGLPLLSPKSRILTHCNAGGLATSELGTALAPIYLAHQQGIPLKVFADETRPLLQGARLTCWELQQAGIDVTLICDNMAATMMAHGEIDLVITGCDRLAANGDGANKIGTLGLAILARHFNIPFYLACPTSTIDLDTPTGKQIIIEEREPDEITHVGQRRIAPEHIKTRNPAFDVTPADLITGIITEKALLRPPYALSLQQLLARA